MSIVRWTAAIVMAALIIEACAATAKAPTSTSLPCSAVDLDATAKAVVSAALAQPDATKARMAADAAATARGVTVVSLIYAQPPGETSATVKCGSKTATVGFQPVGSALS